MFNNFEIKSQETVEREERDNMILLVGVVSREPILSHEAFGEKFYSFELSAARLSGVMDVLPVIISERVYDVNSIQVGQLIKLKGQVRTYNQHLDELNEKGIRKQKLIISVYATDISNLDTLQDMEPPVQHSNDVYLTGYICKPTTYRQTPKGREVADLMLAVHRTYSAAGKTKSDYIPCICWGKDARYIGNQEVGTKVKLKGKLQSREYNKKISEFESETRVAYEVSVSLIQLSE